MEGSKLILIVSSNADVASKNIAQKVVEGYAFREESESFRENPVYSQVLKEREVKLVTVDDDPVHAQYITDLLKPRLAIFVSRHSSRSGIPTLSVHTPGNLGEALYGGVPRKVSISPANPMRSALLEMVRQKERLGLREFEVTYECTHHGPSLDVPAMFVEVGSTPEQWMNLKAAEAVAHAAIASITKASRCPAVLGVGGPHYNRRFTELALEAELAFGHMIPKYAAASVDGEMVRQCIERTMEGVEMAVFDWKGIDGENRRRIVRFLEEEGVRVRRTRDLE
ncbi:MAG: D-aminoacyl-tRNA deacylase [Candidatus Bathyarchaeia archaeon]